MGTARHICLLSRSGRASSAGPWAGLVQNHTMVSASAADVSAAADAEGTWAQQQGGVSPVSAVFHAAGVLTDAMMGQQSNARLRRFVYVCVCAYVCMCGSR